MYVEIVSVVEVTVVAVDVTKGGTSKNLQALHVPLSESKEKPSLHWYPVTHTAAHTSLTVTLSW